MTRSEQAEGGSSGLLWKVGLAVLIVAGVAAGYFAAKSGTNTKVEPKGMMTFACTNSQCGKAMVVELKALATMEHSWPPTERDRPKYKCSSCGQLSAVEGMVCSKCNKAFRTDTVLPVNGAYTCPFCQAVTPYKRGK